VLAGRWPQASAAIDPQRAKSHMDLLQSRRPEVPALHALRETLEGARHHADAAAARWVFPAHAADATTPSPAPAEAGPRLPTAAQVTAAAQRLRAARTAAATRQARPFRGAVSEEAHKALRELLAQQRYGADTKLETVAREPGNVGGSAQRIAMAVGTAVHRALELFDLTADPLAESERQRACFGNVLHNLLTPDEYEAGLHRVIGLWERFQRGVLFERFCTLVPHVIARELPVLLAPDIDANGPVGVISGAIDLLYRDPDSGELVVADYKSDVIESDAEIAECVRAYATQGALYTRAVHAALELAAPPRFELWFLHAGRIA
jgi:ATP-dependent exoDNAse (exonuclease V) beta subunit